MIDKDVMKLFEKSFPTVNKVPLLGIHKKRGTPFAFLLFESNEQKIEFSDLFNNELGIKGKLRIKEVAKKLDRGMFRKLLSKEEMKEEHQVRKEKNLPTKEEIE
jgi:hypothetical protein